MRPVHPVRPGAVCGMVPPGMRRHAHRPTGPVQGIARRRAAPCALAALAALAVACTVRGAPPPEAWRDRADALRAALAAAPSAASSPTDLVVRLAFGAGADLDLYVTGPREETVYFANTPSRIGGHLEADLRCDAPAPRIETVVFPDAPAGRYRVGVDFPARCDARRDGVPFVVTVRSAHGTREQAGWLEPGVFEPVVLELVHAPAADQASSSSGSPTGMRTVKRVPVPAEDWRSMLPPWRRTISREMARPSPVPSPTGLVVKNGS